MGVVEHTQHRRCFVTLLYVDPRLTSTYTSTVIFVVLEWLLNVANILK